MDQLHQYIIVALIKGRPGSHFNLVWISLQYRHKVFFVVGWNVTWRNYKLGGRVSWNPWQFSSVCLYQFKWFPVVDHIKLQLNLSSSMSVTSR